jgi:hypothetical protein
MESIALLAVDYASQCPRTELRPRSGTSQEKHKPGFSKHLSFVEKIVEELLRPLKMSDGLLRIGHPKCDLTNILWNPYSDFAFFRIQ